LNRQAALQTLIQLLTELSNLDGLTGRLSKHALARERIRELHGWRLAKATPPDAMRPVLA
jgi:hypothetical protein